MDRHMGLPPRLYLYVIWASSLFRYLSGASWSLHYPRYRPSKHWCGTGHDVGFLEPSRLPRGLAAGMEGDDLKHALMPSGCIRAQSFTPSFLCLIRK